MSVKIYKNNQWIETAGQPAQFVQDITMFGNNLKFGMNDGFEINYQPVFTTLDTNQTITGIKTLHNNLVFDAWHNDGGTGPAPIITKYWTDKLYFGNVWLYAEKPDFPTVFSNDTHLKLCGNYESITSLEQVTGNINFPILSDETNGKTLALKEDVANDHYTKTQCDNTFATKSTTYTKTECNNTFATQTALQQGLATREVAGACYTKTESDNKYATLAVNFPINSFISTAIINVSNGFYKIGNLCFWSIKGYVAQNMYHNTKVASTTLLPKETSQLTMVPSYGGTSLVGANLTIFPNGDIYMYATGTISTGQYVQIFGCYILKD